MKIFFSWQSDIKENRAIIEPALKDAVSEFNSTMTPDSVLENDSATRNTPGAPDIAITILDKIRNADFFVCDVTPIIADKDIANSNVMFELGFAVSCLGWERIILLYNTSKGNIETQLPFDIKTHNIHRFTTNGEAKNNISNLKHEILKTLKLVYEENPSKMLLSIEQRELICKKRDIENLKWVISRAFCLKFWDNFFDEFPTAHFNNAITSFYVMFCDLHESSYWFFYDPMLNKYFEDFFSNICSLMDKSDPLMIFSQTHMIIPKVIWSDDDHNTFQECVKLMNCAQQAYLSLIKYIRNEYLEVEIDSLSDEAGRRYIQEQNDFKEKFLQN